ncbi:hypothetical protein ACRRTK_002397 [Alexandromys fortis]
MLQHEKNSKTGNARWRRYSNFWLHRGLDNLSWGHVKDDDPRYHGDRNSGKKHSMGTEL